METKTIIGLWIMIVAMMDAAYLMHGGLTGNVTARMYVRSDESFSGNAYLQEGWNLVSFPATPPDSNVSSVLAHLSTNYSSLHYYETQDHGDLWKVHHRTLAGSIVQDLTAISSKKGYWISMANRSAAESSGTISSVNQIPLYAGWNMIGYPSNTTRTAASAFSPINGSYSSVYAYFANDTGDPWKVYNPNIGAEFNDLANIQPFYGYWVNATTNVTLTIFNI